MTPTAPPHSSLRARASHCVIHVLCAALCLTTALALEACSGPGARPESAAGTNVTDTAESSNGRVSTRTGDAPTIAAATASASPSSPNIRPRSGDAPSVTPWTPPSLKFYNEDYSVWYQDDSVVRTDAVSDHGNIEGFRTHDNACMGYETRDISENTHNNPLSDDEISSIKVNVKEKRISDVVETGREAVSLVRDDGGTMEGYSITWTGTYTADGAEPEEVEGYKFTRAVREAGLDFSVMAMCTKGQSMSSDQWRTVLGGIRVEGLTAGKMGK